MTHRFYRVADHVFEIVLMQDADEALMPSYVPFALSEKQEPLFRISVDDTFKFEDDLEEIGQFDCGGCNHGVYRTASDGYRF